MSQLMEKILSQENMTLAYKKVKANKGASGIDGITVDEVHQYLKENWPSIKERIQKRKYKPNLFLGWKSQNQMGECETWGYQA